MKDGTVIKGSLTMISIDFIRFLKENETTPVDIQKDDIKSLTGIDGEIDLNNIDVKSPPDFDTLNRLTLEEYQKLSTKEKAIYDARNNEVNEQFSYPKSLANEYDRLYYKQIYSNIRSERQGGNVLCCVVFTCLLVSVWISGLKFNYGGGLWEPSSNI